jgi:hypothetical protein
MPSGVADIHIDKSENEDSYDLIVTDPAGRDAAERLADRLEQKLVGYSSDIKRSARGDGAVLSFTADKQPLDKYSAGRLNTEALMEHAEEESRRK